MQGVCSSTPVVSAGDTSSQAKVANMFGCVSTAWLCLQAVVSDVPSCGGVSYGREHGIPTLTYPASKKGLFPGLSREQLLQEMTDRGVDYVLLAGYLKAGSTAPSQTTISASFLDLSQNCLSRFAAGYRECYAVTSLQSGSSGKQCMIVAVPHLSGYRVGPSAYTPEIVFCRTCSWSLKSWYDATSTEC